MANLPPGGNSVLPSQKFTLDVSTELGESKRIKTYAVITCSNRGSSIHGELVGTYQPVMNSKALSFKQLKPNGLGAFDLDLTLLPADIEKVVIFAFIDDSLSSFTDFGTIKVSTGDITGVIDCDQMNETALILAEIYTRNNQWKMRINGQGFIMGISALSKNLDLELNCLKELCPPPSLPSVGSTSPDRVSLTKSNKSISLTKASGSYGKILVNLNWNQKSERGGFFGRRATGIDLDLGAFVETIDGQSFVIQALGNMFGSYDHAPFTRLLEDDRTGAAKSGEWLNINGDKWAKVKRVLVYAFIYEGVPNWQETDGIVKVIVPGQPEIEVRMNEYGDTRGACAVASLENINGDVKVTREVTFHISQKEMDQQYKWGFNWTVGSK